MSLLPRKPRLFIALVGATLVLSTTLAACSSVGSYAARVDGHSISEDDLLGELQAIAANTDYLKQLEQSRPVVGTGKGTFDSTFTALALTRQIYYLLIGTELDKRKLKVSSAQLGAARDAAVAQLDGEEVLKKFPEAYQSDLVRHQAEIDLLTIAASGLGDPDNAARTYFDQHPDEFAEAACASHILVPDAAKAQELRQKLVDGADFAAMAKAESKDPGSAEKGGEVGCGITRTSELVAPFLDSVFAQPVGEVGQPVQTEFGFHLIKVTSRGVPKFEEAQEAINEKITTLGQDKLREILKARLESAKIEINPKYGTFDRTGANPGVVPPASGAVTTTVPEPSAPDPAAP